MIVEVAYALPNKQSLISIEVESGSTLKEAIEASGILEVFEQIDLRKDRVGIFPNLQPLILSFVKRTELKFIDLLLLILKKLVRRGQLREKQCEAIKKTNPR